MISTRHQADGSADEGLHAYTHDSFVRPPVAQAPLESVCGTAAQNAHNAAAPLAHQPQAAATQRRATSGATCGSGTVPRRNGSTGQRPCACTTGTASWYSVDATPSMFVTHEQLLETVFGQRTRRVSSETLAKVKTACPAANPAIPWHCFHAVFSETVLRNFTQALNANLEAARQPDVSIDEFVQWIAMFLLRCIVPYRHRGTVAFVTGQSGWEGAAHVMHYERFLLIQGHLALVTRYNRSTQVPFAVIHTATCTLYYE